MEGPKPKTNREYLLRIYDELRRLNEHIAKQNNRLTVVENEQQKERDWRNRIIGGGVIFGILFSGGLAIVRLWA